MSSRCAAAAPTTQDSTISALISDLAADDASARKTAAQKLIDLGESSRAAVLQATKNDDPAIRAQASQILLKLPWWQADDPPEVKDLLSHYNEFTPPPQLDVAGNPIPIPINPPGAPAPGPANYEQNRAGIIHTLASLPDGKGLNALTRLISEDPSEIVRWALVHDLRVYDDGSRLAKFRLLDPPPDSDGPMTALDGFAWLAADSRRAEPLLKKGLEAALKSPAHDDGDVDSEIALLTDLQIAAHHYEDAASILRDELKQNPPTDSRGLPLPLARLFALHANHGPLPGFDEDRKAAGDFLSSPKLQYAMAQIAARQNHPEQAESIRKDAFNADSNSRVDRYETGKYLSENGWNAEAEAEFKAYLSMPSSAVDGGEASEVNAHFALAELAARRGDDFQAAEQKKSAMLLLGGGTHPDLIQTDALGHTTSIAEDQIWAEIHWRYLKAAQTRKDEAAIDTELKEILQLNPADVDIAIDAVPLLKSRKETDAAAQLFSAAYKFQRDKLDADPDNASLKNGLAWLDAKCDENLDEAMKLATAAVASNPDNSAMIDTLAEINFHLGHPDKAVELETKALQLEPGDKFMTGQLARFQANVDKKK